MTRRGSPIPITPAMWASRPARRRINWREVACAALFGLWAVLAVVTLMTCAGPAAGPLPR